MGFMLIIWVVILIVIGLIIWAVVTAAGKSTKPSETQETENSALETLKRRYARGEIDKEEFEAKKKDLL